MRSFNTFDYVNFMKQFVDGFKTDLELTLVPGMGNAEVPKYPFITYDFVNTHIDIGASVELQDQFDIILMFTTHSNLLSQSLNTGSKIMMWFKDREVQYMLSEQGIDIVQIYDQTQLNNPMAIDTDRRVKFEVRFRVINVEADESNPNIERVITSDNIDVKKG